MAKKQSLATKIRTNRKRSSGTAEGLDLNLRIDFSQIVFRILKVGKATPEQLADASGHSLPVVDAILRADYDVDTADIGSIAAALGVEFHLRADTAM